jgi:hypothetical protein
MKALDLTLKAFVILAALWLVAYPALKVLVMAIEGTLP